MSDLQIDNGSYPFGSRKRLKIPWLNIVLFLLTLFSTMFFGSYMVHFDENIFRFCLRLFRYEPSWWLDGAPFSITLMAILLSHEMGHYLFSRYHRVKASLPYFIPAPNLVGTFGALILMRDRIQSRKALIDIGSVGPIAGFIVSVFALYVGVKNARLVPISEVQGSVLFNPNLIIALAFKLYLAEMNPGMVVQSPILDAAWVGFFVTMLNLLPIGQLDGGHIAHAVLGRKSNWLSWGMVIFLLAMSLFWIGWGVFALFILLLMGRRGINHPPVLMPEPELGFSRKLLAFSVLLVFVLTFIPMPFIDLESARSLLPLLPR